GKEGITIPAGNYLVFKKVGAMPQALIAAWTEVWNYFSQEQSYQRAYLCDFESYSGSEEVSVYIGVK
ncbi:MAG: AraC family transcriptional regulator, partial [Legionella sp.]